MIKYVFSDFFGVVTSEVAPTWLRRHMSVEEAIAYKRDVVTKVDEGEITFMELCHYLEEKTGVKAEQVHQDWLDIVTPHEDYIAYLRALHPKYHIALLSNASSQFAREMLERFDLYTVFHDLFISAEIRLIKPHADYFEYALKTLGADPGECVFIDDNKENCRAASALGIHAVVYHDFEQVRRDLTQLGVTL